MTATTTGTITIEIDGKPVQSEPGKMIIEVADETGVHIPRFCYHKKLSIAANCRMCLVEVEKAPKPLPACATPVTDGMKIYTQSEKALAAQKAVMEFLLINHPLDCPICDQGGECELQDVAMGYGSDLSRYTEGKRSVHDKNIGPLIETEMTRCIHCTRCVRFGEEIAGMRELGGTGRGEKTEIGTYIEKSLRSELSGNVIDLCPVGALTAKPSRYTARPWELTQHKTIAPHDGIGSNIYVHTRSQQVMRVVPRENEAINETWISDRDRFSYIGLQSADRVLTPQIKRHGVWENADWQTALAQASSSLRHIRDQFGASEIAAWLSPNNTVEEAYLLQKFMRGIGSDHIDYRLSVSDTRDQDLLPRFPHLPIPIQEIEQQNVVLLVGLNPHREHPLLGYQVRKAALHGAKVLSLDIIKHQTHFDLTQNEVVPSAELIDYLAGIAKALLTKVNTSAIHFDHLDKAKHLLQHVQPSAMQQKMAEQLTSGDKKLILMGAIAINHPDAAVIRSLTQLIATLSGAKFGECATGANSAGAWLAGAVPHREAAGNSLMKAGDSFADCLQKDKKAFVLLGVEPEFDSFNPALALKKLKQAELVIVLTPFVTPAMLEYADIILPVASFSETSGTYINMEGTWQSFAAAIKAMGEARPAWKVLRVLGNFFELNGFEYESSQDVLHELKARLLKSSQDEIGDWYCPSSLNSSLAKDGVQRVSQWAIYSIDNLTRRSLPLQNSATQESDYAYISPSLAARLNLTDQMSVVLKQGEQQAIFNIKIAENLPDNTVLTYAGLAQSTQLGSLFGEIELQASAL